MYPDKVTVVMMMAISPEEIKDIDKLVENNKEKIEVGLSIIPKTMLKWYNE